MEMYDKAYDQPLNIFSNWNPDIVEDDIYKILTDYNIDVKKNDNKYKLKFDHEGTYEEHKEKKWKLSICIRILKVDEETVCIEFTKLSGPQDKYTDIVKNVKSHKIMTEKNDVLTTAWEKLSNLIIF